MHCIISDLFELPTGYSWEFVTLDDGEILLIAQADIRSAFYMFRIPVGWSRYMTVTGKTRIHCQDGKVRYTYLGCAVLPMGWNSAVSICQRLHRRLVRGLVGNDEHDVDGRGLPTTHGIKRSEAFPLHLGWLPHLWWSVYGDDWKKCKGCRLLRAWMLKAR